MYQPPYHNLHHPNNQTFSSNKYKLYFKPSSIPHSQSHTNLTSPNPNQFSFKPTLIPSKLYTGSTTYNSKTFLTRQEDFTRKLEQKKQKMDNEHFNKITNNLHLKTSYKIPLSSLLTNYQRNLNKYYQSKQSLYEKYYANPTYNFNNLNTNTSSKKIIVDVYTKSFVKLFNDLDTDEDGLISPISILKTIKHIDKEINRIIEPIITELNEENYTLSQEEFISAMFELIKDLNNEDKQIVFNYYKMNKCKDKKEKQIKSRQYSFRVSYYVNNIFIYFIYIADNKRKVTKYCRELRKENAT